MDRVREEIDFCEDFGDGTGVTIAVIDTGVDALHPDISDRVVYFKDFVRGSSTAYDDHGHGTHIAGIICGTGIQSSCRYQGVAKGAKIVSLKVLDENGNAKTNTVLKALEWVLQNYKKYNIRCLNFSIGFLPNTNKDDQKQLVKVLEEIWDEGIVVLTAAGNNGPANHSITIPGVSRKVITVGSGKVTLDSFSGRGPSACCITKPEVYAPGKDIISLKVGGGYEKRTGTSMAAPVVAGVVALVLGAFQEFTPNEIKYLLYLSSKKKKNLPSEGWGCVCVKALYIACKEYNILVRDDEKS